MYLEYQCGGPLIGVLIGAGVGPFADGGLDEALSLPVGAWGVGPGGAVFESEGAAQGAQGAVAYRVYTQEILAQPVKLAFRSLSLDETAKFLGVPPARAKAIEALVESNLNGAQRHAKRNRSTGLSMKRLAKKTIKRAGANKAR